MILLLGGPRREEIGTPLECGAPEEVLSVKVSLDEVLLWTSLDLVCLLTFYLCLMLFVFDTTTLLFMLCRDYGRSYGVCTY